LKKSSKSRLYQQNLPTASRPLDNIVLIASNLCFAAFSNPSKKQGIGFGTVVVVDQNIKPAKERYLNPSLSPEG
jgi:hypothetical protein